ncbi:hypothetical protein V9T40_001626 [Parthenolecanium corni]|uniref:Uncharacterized protein n=1 Tax=Parthenolecanium corni TaxID=536013 RepID=A0AAN9TKJ8_9HEMI
MAPSWLFIFNDKLTAGNHLTRAILPAIELDKQKHYSLGLIYFSSFNTIPNITDKNNSLRVRFDVLQGFKNNLLPFDKISPEHLVSPWLEIKIPEGIYDLEKLLSVLTNLLRQEFMRWNEKHFNAVDGESLDFIFDSATYRVMIIDVNNTCKFDFTRKNSIGPLLGFNEHNESTNWTNNHAYILHHHIADKEPSIHPFNSVNIFCNLIKQSYLNGEENHILYSFPYKISPSQQIHEYPQEIIYLPINTTSIREIALSLRDEHGKEIILPDTRVVISLRLKEE